MFRLLIVGLWTCLATLGGTYGGAYWRTRQSAAPEAEHAEKVEVHKARPLTVPIITGGALKGYVSAELSFVSPAIDKHAPAQLDPESFFLDEAFRLIYSDPKIDFSNIQKADLSALTEKITANVNQRMGRMAIKETLLRNLSYISREDMPR